MNRTPVTPYMIAIGGSAGALGPLIQVLAGLPQDFRAAVLVVIHTAPGSPGMLPVILGRSCALKVTHAEDGAPIEAGRVYVAPPDRHLLVGTEGMKLVRGPRENRSRPAIDPLFRTAARTGGRRVAGVLLSGLLNDGTYGLMAIRQHGGTVIVQDPRQAAFPDMPQNALDDVEVDRVLPAVDIPDVLKGLVSKQSERRSPAGETAEEEEAGGGEPVAALPGNSLEKPPAGQLSPFVCPDCGGALWESEEGKLTRYRCHVGHGFTAEVLLNGLQEELESALWAALRMIEENMALSRRLAQRADTAGHLQAAQQHQENANDMEQHADLLQRLLQPA